MYCNNEAIYLLYRSKYVIITGTPKKRYMKRKDSGVKKEFIVRISRSKIKLLAFVRSINRIEDNRNQGINIYHQAPYGFPPTNILIRSTGETP